MSRDTFKAKGSPPNDTVEEKEISNTTDKMLIKIDKDLAEFITTMAENNGISKAGYVNSLLEKAIKQEIEDE